jgi:4-hydroxyacetophenone monooxygenase
VAGFPNLFMIYGPNTQPGHGGSILGSNELQIGYVIRLLTIMRERRIGAIEIKREAYEDYAARVDAEHARMVWTHPRVNTYYRNSRGRVVVNSPWRNVDFWKLTRRPNLDDYVQEPVSDRSIEGQGP